MSIAKNVIREVMASPLLCAIVIGTFGAFAYVATHPVRTSSKYVYARECRRHVEQLLSAIAMYKADFGQGPPTSVIGADGKPWHAWTVLLLPYIGQEELYREYRFDEPWDGPHNRLLHGRSVAEFRCSVSPDKTANDRNYFLRPELISAASFSAAPQEADLMEVYSSGVHYLQPAIGLPLSPRPRAGDHDGEH